MARECDVLGQLDMDEEQPLQVNVVTSEYSNYVYHKNECLLEVTSGKVDVQIPEGYAVVFRTSTNVLNNQVYTRIYLNEENGVRVDKGSVFGLVKLTPLNIVNSTQS